MVDSQLWREVKKRKKYTRRSETIPKIFVGKKEKFFLEKVVAVFHRHKWKCYHHDTRNPRFSWLIGKGFPDLVCAKKFRRYRYIKRKVKQKVRGRYRLVMKKVRQIYYETVLLFIELKLYKRYPTKEQKEWMDTLPDKRTYLCENTNKDWNFLRKLAKRKRFA